ncbi:TrbG/VirB9 family P-type conjugative transfer protein [Entomobacter blattae]|uniref:Type IV secretion system protein virB9 n=1 Tax=Entomobacter blattae TaxID=2762277 RepID=A0A7H1NRP2_9PROT|nr:TrbG/VirB9 family P-type conjugative transfer protein [Entomobacter blattae]QNT77566.1 Type IV secretion system protein virB9 [Entomobacter blattae]QNT78452.1 Type IV secretion system protein virB9 [Entomobacter blattae]
MKPFSHSSRNKIGKGREGRSGENQYLLLWTAALTSSFLFSLYSIPSHGLERKQVSPYDYRIKSALYNPQDTVVIDSVVGVTTHITVSPQETYLAHAFGDSKAWDFAHVKNHFFVKPVAENADTNLTIITDKHTYHIMLHYIGELSSKSEGKDGKKGFIRSPWQLRQATLELTYKYPDDDEKQEAREVQEHSIQSAFANPYISGRKNLNYTMAIGDDADSIKPVNVWDNGELTYFKFPEKIDLPTLFVMGQDGKESVVNSSVSGENHNIIVAQMVAEKWVIRSGDKVIGIRNTAYNPRAIFAGRPTGTTSPYVRRIANPAQEDK